MAGEIYLKNAAAASTLDSGTTGDKFGTYYLAENPKEYEVQRSNTFELRIEGLNKTLNIPQNEVAAAAAEDVLKLSVNSSSVPHFTQNVIEVKRGNNSMKFAGAATFGEGTIKFNDYIGAGTKDVLTAWQQKAYTVRTEKVGLAKDYKRTGTLVEYTPDFQIVRTWKLYGCWISGLSEDEYNSDSAEKHNITATIQYDKAMIDLSEFGA